MIATSATSQNWKKKKKKKKKNTGVGTSENQKYNLGKKGKKKTHLSNRHPQKTQ
jgi:hypothetical protein